MGATTLNSVAARNESLGSVTVGQAAACTTNKIRWPGVSERLPIGRQWLIGEGTKYNTDRLATSILRGESWRRCVWLDGVQPISRRRVGEERKREMLARGKEPASGGEVAGVAATKDLKEKGGGFLREKE